MTATLIAPPAFFADEPVAPGLTLVDSTDALQESAASREVRVLVADGQALVRAGYLALLHSEAGIAVACEATTGDEAVALARRTCPDVVLLDANLPGLDSVEVTRQIALLPRTRVMILTSREDDDNLFPLLRAGASACLVKDSKPAELVEAIRVVARGDAALSPSVTRRLIARFVSEAHARRPTPDGLEELTEREREVMALAAHGLSNAELAERLAVRPATAKTHINRAMLKLRARNRAQLVAFAYESGLVAFGRPGPVAV